MQKILVSFLALSCISAFSFAVEPTTEPVEKQNNSLGSFLMNSVIQSHCKSELNNVTSWKVATKLMPSKQKAQLEKKVCTCVSDNAPFTVVAADWALAMVDSSMRSKVASIAVAKSINGCIASSL